MLRELVDALEQLTAVQPLVLVLEDLHWSDASTVEVLALLARRREAARLLVLGTYRPVEVIVHEHPLKAVKQELVAHGQVVEVPLGYLAAGGGGGLSGAARRRAGAARGEWRRACIGAPRAIRCSWCSWWTIWRSRARRQALPARGVRREGDPGPGGAAGLQQLSRRNWAVGGRGAAGVGGGECGGGGVCGGQCGGRAADDARGGGGGV